MTSRWLRWFWDNLSQNRLRYVGFGIIYPLATSRFHAKRNNFALYGPVSYLVIFKGRTGRAGKSGRATGFLTLECKIASDLRKLLKAGKQVS